MAADFNPIFDYDHKEKAGLVEEDWESAFTAFS